MRIFKKNSPVFYGGGCGVVAPPFNGGGERCDRGMNRLEEQALYTHSHYPIGTKLARAGKSTCSDKMLG